jgi:hypothetical protein
VETEARDAAVDLIAYEHDGGLFRSRSASADWAQEVIAKARRKGIDLAIKTMPQTLPELIVAAQAKHPAQDWAGRDQEAVATEQSLIRAFESLRAEGKHYDHQAFATVVFPAARETFSAELAEGGRQISHYDATEGRWKEKGGENELPKQVSNALKEVAGEYRACDVESRMTVVKSKPLYVFGETKFRRDVSAVLQDNLVGAQGPLDALSAHKLQFACGSVVDFAADEVLPQREGRALRLTQNTGYAFDEWGSQDGRAAVATLCQELQQFWGAGGGGGGQIQGPLLAQVEATAGRRPGAHETPAELLRRRQAAVGGKK